MNEGTYKVNKICRLLRETSAHDPTKKFDVLQSRTFKQDGQKSFQSRRLDMLESFLESENQSTAIKSMNGRIVESSNATIKYWTHIHLKT